MSQPHAPVLSAFPATLTALVRGLNRRHPNVSSFDQPSGSRGFGLILYRLHDGKKAAGQHQKDDDDGHGKSLAVFDVLYMLFGEHTGTS